MSRRVGSPFGFALAAMLAGLGIVSATAGTCLADETAFAELPALCECHGNEVGTYGTREFDLASPRTSGAGLTSPYSFPDGTAQAVVQDAWNEFGGTHDAQGFCRLDGCYLVACTSYFGEVGDRVDFEFSDGSSIETVVVDTKGEGGLGDVASRYGHDECQNVLEFCGEDCIGDDPLVTLGKSGLSVVGFSNYGVYAGVAESLGEL